MTVMPNRGAAALQYMPFIQSRLLSPEDRRSLMEIAYPPRTLRGGVDLISEGAHTDCVYFLIQGWACRYKTTREGARQITGFVVPGDLCNLDSFVLQELNFGVRTLRAATVLGLPRDRVRARAGKSLGITQAVSRFAVLENAMLTEWALALGRKTARERLAHLLCELAVRLGRDVDGRAEFELPVTQDQIADALGLTGVHVNRTMQQLRTDGMIVAEGRQMAIPDMAALSRIGGFDPAYLHSSKTDEATAFIGEPVFGA